MQNTIDKKSKKYSETVIRKWRACVWCSALWPSYTRYQKEIVSKYKHTSSLYFNISFKKFKLTSTQLKANLKWKCMLWFINVTSNTFSFFQDLECIWDGILKHENFNHHLTCYVNALEAKQSFISIFII